jgi:methyl-accepting chemotaxis protein
MVISGMWLQEAESISTGNSRLLLFFVGMVAIAMAVQAIVFVIAALGTLKVSKRLLGIAEEVKAKTLPALERTENMLQEIHPKMRIITDNLVETTEVVRAKAEEFDSTITEVNARARAQTARVDDMVTSVLDTTAGIASTIQKGVQVPVREFQGIMNGIRAGIDVLVGRRNHTPSARYRGDDGL